jgi:hypothetical protein
MALSNTSSFRKCVMALYEITACKYERRVVAASPSQQLRIVLVRGMNCSRVVTAANSAAMLQSVGRSRLSFGGTPIIRRAGAHKRGDTRPAACAIGDPVIADRPLDRSLGARKKNCLIWMAVSDSPLVWLTLRGSHQRCAPVKPSPPGGPGRFSFDTVRAARSLRRSDGRGERAKSRVSRQEGRAGALCRAQAFPKRA